MTNLTTNNTKVTVVIGTQVMEVELAEATNVAAILTEKGINFSGATVTLKPAGENLSRVISPDSMSTTQVQAGYVLSVNTKTDNGAFTINALVGTNPVTVLVEEGANLAAVLTGLGLDGKAFTVVLNGNVVPQVQVQGRTVSPGDHVSLNTRVSNG